MTRLPVRLASLPLVLALTAACGLTSIGGGGPDVSGTTGTATATLRDSAGTTVGAATLTETNVGILINGSLNNVAPGAHGIHVHAVGRCTPTFAEAGGHFNPRERRHGFRNPDGHHAGDLPNIHVPQGGGLTFELTLPDVRLGGSEGLLDSDGAALVVHAGADDYMTDPAGASGSRIACGVIMAR